MKYASYLILAVFAAVLSGCATNSTQFSHVPLSAPTAEQVAAAKADIRAFLESPTAQYNTKRGIVVAANLALSFERNQTKQDALRKRIAAIGAPIALLASGGARMTPADVKGLIVGNGAQVVSQQGAAINDAILYAWSLVYPKLVAIDDVNLWRIWLLLIAEAAEEVGPAPSTGIEVPAISNL